MKYTKEEKLNIAKSVFNHELSYKAASEKYLVSMTAIYFWVKEYKEKNNIDISFSKTNSNKNKDYEELNSLSKKEVIDEVIKARIEKNEQKKDTL